MYSSPYVELNFILPPKYEEKQLIDQLNMYFYLTRLRKAEDKSLMRSLESSKPTLNRSNPCVIPSCFLRSADSR